MSTTNYPGTEQLVAKYDAAKSALNAVDTIAYTIGGPDVDRLKADYLSAKEALEQYEVKFFGAKICRS